MFNILEAKNAFFSLNLTKNVDAFIENQRLMNYKDSCSAIFFGAGLDDCLLPLQICFAVQNLP